MSVISWRSGRIDRVCRSATCAETRAVVDLEDELFAFRYQWSLMLGNSVMDNSPDDMARLVAGATHGDRSQGQGTTCGYRMPGFEGRIGDFLSQVFVGTQWSATG